ncbi:hypothetical protein MVES1_003521 [Malassezia vespertilionis]|uniref:Nitroreductase domain-containing protein n=1 Tax=Malassezia vespertilionis TaxID=2020962 RepID=A0A2N1J6Z6_9BASI|nr:uncharacterized protein MVES1_003521 [Malassezia vespertilionis]PKI82335.1 hypothetical protein MVES_003759 [Malassezia vespertilionis]WFD08151.1 hypothetical protein MVES1_003521 [Malassezia vespertilionis]
MSATSYAKKAGASFLELIAKRRSIYHLSDETILSPQQVTALIRTAVREAPSPFNVQSSRAIILFGKDHKNYWNSTVPGALFESSGERAVEASKPKLQMFEAGSGTVVFFEDKSAVKGMQDKFPRYAPQFPIWSYQSNGMAQVFVWTLLEAEGYGCNLQHYGNLTGEKVKEQYNLPDSYEIQAEMVFGCPLAPAGEKTFIDDNSRVMSFGA